MGKIEIDIKNLDKILKTSELVKDKKENEEYRKLVEEANKRIELAHIEEGKTYIKAMNYIAK